MATRRSPGARERRAQRGGGCAAAPEIDVEGPGAAADAEGAGRGAARVLADEAGGSSYSGGGPLGRARAPPHAISTNATPVATRPARIGRDGTTRTIAQAAPEGRFDPSKRLFSLTGRPPRCTFRRPAGLPSGKRNTTRASAQSTRPPAQAHDPVRRLLQEERWSRRGAEAQPKGNRAHDPASFVSRAPANSR